MDEFDVNGGWSNAGIRKKILGNRQFYKHIHLVRILIHLRVVSRIWLTEK